MSVASIEASTLPTRARATMQYIVVIKNNEIIIVSGRFFAGFFISPAIAAILVTPAEDIYKKATAAIKPFDQSENTGYVNFVSKELKPRIIITIRDIMLTETIKS